MYFSAELVDALTVRHDLLERDTESKKFVVYASTATCATVLARTGEEAMVTALFAEGVTWQLCDEDNLQPGMYTVHSVEEVVPKWEATPAGWSGEQFAQFEWADQRAEQLLAEIEQKHAGTLERFNVLTKLTAELEALRGKLLATMAQGVLEMPSPETIAERKYRVFCPIQATISFDVMAKTRRGAQAKVMVADLAHLQEMSPRLQGGAWDAARDNVLDPTFIIDLDDDSPE